jgi:hypothetical protein
MKLCVEKMTSTRFHLLVLGRVMILVPLMAYFEYTGSVQGVAFVIVCLPLFAIDWVPL